MFYSSAVNVNHVCARKLVRWTNPQDPYSCSTKEACLDLSCLFGYRGTLGCVSMPAVNELPLTAFEWPLTNLKDYLKSTIFIFEKLHSSQARTMRSVLWIDMPFIAHQSAPASTCDLEVKTTSTAAGLGDDTISLKSPKSSHVSTTSASAGSG